jgi:hypothetical protein
MCYYTVYVYNVYVIVADVVALPVVPAGAPGG